MCVPQTSFIGEAWCSARCGKSVRKQCASESEVLLSYRASFAVIAILFPQDSMKSLMQVAAAFDAAVATRKPSPPVFAEASAVAPIPKAQPKAASASSNGRVVATSGDAASGASPSPSGAVGTTSKATHAVASAVLDRLLQGKQPLPLTYGAIRSLLPMLQQRYPHLVRVRDAVEAFGLEDEVTGLMCGRATCQVPFIELGLRSAVNRSTPTLFYSGLVHGDEVVGPTVSVYLAALLASQFDVHAEVFYLLTNRLLVGGAFERYLFVGGITWHGGMRAIARPWGSYDHADPIGRGAFQSRRAPDDVAFAALGKWLQEAGGPSATEYMSPYLSEHFVALQRKQREELLQRLKREHSGSLLNVLLNDDSAEKTFKPPPHPYYPEGPIADLVYPVNGGLEDWAYSAAFQSYPNPISACLIRKRGSQTRHPRDAHSTDAYDFESEPFQDFNQLTASASWWPSLRGWGTPQGAPERSRNQVIPHEREGVRCAMYLVETHDDKNPKPTEYGKFPLSLARRPTLTDGLVARNVRIAFKLAEKVQPDILLLAAPAGYQAPGCIANFAIWPVGCQTLDSLRIVAKRGRCSDFVRKEERPLPAGISSEFGEDDHEVYELTSAWHSADVLNDELILQRSCRSAAPWQRSTGQKVEPLYQAWKKDQNEIYNDFSAAERDGLEFLRFKVPPETPSGEICMLLLGEFDKEWTETLKTADPSIEPQSWLVTSRAKNTRANAPKGAGILKSGREWIFPARSPSFPGNPTPVGIPIQIREDSIEAFATVSLSLPAREATASPRGGVAKKVILPVTEPCTVSLTFSGFLNDDPVFLNPYTRLLMPVMQLRHMRLQQQQPDRLPLPGATKGAGDVLLRIKPKRSRLPDGLLLVQVRRHDPHYSSSNDTSGLVHVALVSTGSSSAKKQQQQRRQLNRVLLQTDGEVRFAEGCCPDLLLRRQSDGWSFRAVLSTKTCGCGPGTAAVGVSVGIANSSSKSSNSSFSIGADEELLGATIYRGSPGAPRASASRLSYGVYSESPEQRSRVLHQLREQQ
ncbi:uncharacterized protein LOC34623211, partial [Cyclospora cayetanensis]|uniref:Uncharacterized protein LOC34623211 n=1 Tax=Cyclospora cayetanensis TaxID=88456 RepID=A0A6P6RQ93_9EIME